jgi:hypothetical protein
MAANKPEKNIAMWGVYVGQAPKKKMSTSIHCDSPINRYAAIVMARFNPSLFFENCLPDHARKMILIIVGIKYQ